MKFVLKNLLRIPLNSDRFPDIHEYHKDILVNGVSANNTNQTWTSNNNTTVGTLNTTNNNNSYLNYSNAPPAQLNRLIDVHIISPLSPLSFSVGLQISTWVSITVSLLLASSIT